MVPPMKIGDAIRAARTKAGLTQRQLAEKVGVDKSAVAQWEGGGGGKGISLDNLVEVARILEVKPSELLGEPTPADKMELTDTREIAVVALFRKLSEPLKDVHLNLLRLQTGTRDLPEQESRPSNRRRVVR